MAKGHIASAAIFVVAAMAFLSTSVLAHSWVDCVKYDPVNKVCLGYSRGYPTRLDPNINTEYTYIFSNKPTTQAMCDPIQQSTMNYTAALPMATAQPGETIYTTWEQNGHMAVAGTTKVYIYYYADSTKEFMQVSERLTAPVAGSFDFASLSNCYSSQDNSVCLGQWVVPTNLVPGKTYHFVWFWYFPNPVGQWYSTCFDMNIQTSSHVVGTADMATLLKKGSPPDDYDYGLNAEAKSLIADVTTLAKTDVATPSSTPVEDAASSPMAHASSSASASGAIKAFDNILGLAMAAAVAKAAESTASPSPSDDEMDAATSTTNIYDVQLNSEIPASSIDDVESDYATTVSATPTPAATKKCRPRPSK